MENVTVETLAVFLVVLCVVLFVATLSTQSSKALELADEERRVAKEEARPLEIIVPVDRDIQTNANIADLRERLKLSVYAFIWENGAKGQPPVATVDLMNPLAIHGYCLRITFYDTPRGKALYERSQSEGAKFSWILSPGKEVWSFSFKNGNDVVPIYLIVGGAVSSLTEET